MRYLVLLLAACAAWAQTQFISSGIGDYAMYPSSSVSFNMTSGIQTVATLNASNLKASLCGYVSTAAAATKTLQNLHILIGSITKTGGTDLRIGVQSPSTTTGPVTQPDGTWLAGGAAYATVSNASITANTWLRSGTVGGSLSVSNGTLMCLVVEPENYAGSDSFIVRGASGRMANLSIGGSYNGSAWSNASTMAHLLEFTDGSYGSIGPGIPINSMNQSVVFNTGSSPDEIALKIQPSVSMSVVGMCAENPYSTSTGDVDWILYNGTTAMVTVTGDVNQLYSTSATTSACAYFPAAQTITAGGTYYAALKPTTANNIRVLYNASADAGYWTVYGGGAGVGYSGRTDAGSWSDTSTRRPLIWLLVSGVVTSGGGSTGGAYVVAQ